MKIRGPRKAPVPLEKICSKCKNIKPIWAFYPSKRDGCSSRCIECLHEDNRIRYYNNHKKYLANARKQHHKRKSWYYKQWRESRPIEARRKYWQRDKLRIQKSPKRRIHHRMSTALYLSLKDKKNGKSWEDILGYSTDDLIKHIESMFADGMTWNNMGQWHIDHIIPKSFFEFNSTEDVEFRYCWSLENLRPLWAKDNQEKSAKVDYVEHN